MKAFNSYKSTDDLDELIAKYDTKLVLRNIQEARQIIKKLVHTLKDDRKT